MRRIDPRSVFACTVGLFASLLCAACRPADTGTPAPAPALADLLDVTCTSEDAGDTCWSYRERYADGTADACGRLPDGGAEFAMKLTWEIVDGAVCDTITHSSDPKLLPIGLRVCAVLVERTPTVDTYRSTERNAPLRRTYRRPRAEKSCQPRIDALD